MTAPRRGLLVDYGGVLTTNVFASFKAFCDAEGLHAAAVRDAFAGDPEVRALVADLECGRVSETAFEPRMAAFIGVAEPSGLIDRLFAGMVPDEAMLAAVRAARDQGVRTAMVSNSWGRGRYDRSQLPVLFDAWVISAEEGIRKPSPEIYALGAQRIGLEPADCVFVDDLEVNLPPARELGMAAVHHTRADETLAQLEELLGVSLSG